MSNTPDTVNGRPVRGKITRRELVQLLLIVVAGWSISVLTRATAPLGRDVSSNETARTLLLDRASPSQEVAQPTLTLVEFTDYQCPACRAASPALDAAITKDGHVRVVYKDWPIFGAKSERAARVAIASNWQGIYPAVHKTLMADRRPLDDRVMQDAVEAAGGDWDRLVRDLQQRKVEIERQLRATSWDVVRLGISGTPAYLIGTTLVPGAQSESGFRKAFAQARKSAT
jgi:protein-disulfide isomerase